MRVLIVAIGSTGDVQPMIVVGKELARRGEDVSIAAFSAFRKTIEAAGLSYAPLPIDAEKFIGVIMKPGENPFTYLKRLTAAFHQSFAPMLEAIYQACQQKDALLFTFFASIPQSFANHFGIPLAEVCYCPMYPTKEHCFPTLGIYSVGKRLNLSFYRLAYFLIRQTEKKYVHQWLLKNKMSPCAYDRHDRLILNAYSPSLCPRPAEWPQNVRVVGFLREEEPPFSPPEKLSAFLEAGPCIYIGFGSMTSGDMQRTIPIVQSVLQKLNLRAVLSSGWSSVDDLDGQNIFLLKGYVPHQWLFGKVRAVAHHGGAGTTYAGLREGKPTLVIPFGGDQPFWGARVYQMGCGPKPLPFQRINEKRLTQRLLALDQIGYQENAQRIKRLLEAENGTQMAADILQAYWGGYSKGRCPLEPRQRDNVPLESPLPPFGRGK